MQYLTLYKNGCQCTDGIPVTRVADDMWEIKNIPITVYFDPNKDTLGAIVSGHSDGRSFLVRGLRVVAKWVLERTN